MAVLSVAAAATRSGMSKGAIRRAIHRGTLAATRLPGGNYKWPEYAISDVELDRYVADRRRPGHKRPQEG